MVRSLGRKRSMSAITDRRGVLYKLPTADAHAEEAVARVAATEEPDAIFGLIAAHKAAWAQFVELDDRDHEMFEEGERAADAAMAELMKTSPTTLAGIRAIIQYLVDWDNDIGYYYLPTLLGSPLLA
jgi:hypothetical protein